MIIFLIGIIIWLAARDYRLRHFDMSDDKAIRKYLRRVYGPVVKEYKNVTMIMAVCKGEKMSATDLSKADSHNLILYTQYDEDVENNKYMIVPGQNVVVYKSGYAHFDINKFRNSSKEIGFEEY